MVRHCCAVLGQRGYHTVVTGALSAEERRGFVDDGFELQEALHLLTHDLRQLPAPGPVPTPVRRGQRWDRRRALQVDALAFPPFWRLDRTGFEEAMTATPHARFQVATDHGVVGYAVLGRAGKRGYLQRLAVDPSVQGRGIGAALVSDGLRWMHRHGATTAVVNTQVANERALALYLRLGFTLEASGLAVLARPLGDRQPAS